MSGERTCFVCAHLAVCAYTPTRPANFSRHPPLRPEAAHGFLAAQAAITAAACAQYVADPTIQAEAEPAVDDARARQAEIDAGDDEPVPVDPVTAGADMYPCPGCGNHGTPGGCSHCGRF